MNAFGEKTTFTFDNVNLLPYKLILSTLSGNNLEISSIHSNEEFVGLTKDEISLIRLFDKLTNGSTFKISPDGSKFSYKPGSLVGGSFSHVCGKNCPISYYLEPVMLLSPFARDEINITFTGVTHLQEYPTIDFIESSLVHFMRKTLVNIHSESTCNVQINQIKNAIFPFSDGVVNYKFTHALSTGAQRLEPILFQKKSKIRKIYVSYWRKNVPKSIINISINQISDALTKYTPMSYISFTESCNKNKFFKKGKVEKCEEIEHVNQNAYGFIIQAESLDGCRVCAEDGCFSGKSDDDKNNVFDTGEKTVEKFLHNVCFAGCISPELHTMCLLFMALSGGDVSKCTFGPLSNNSMKFLQLVKLFLNIRFKIDHIENLDYSVSCKSVNYVIPSYSNF